MFRKVHELGYLLSLSSITVRIAGLWMSRKAQAPFCKKSNICMHNITALGHGNAQRLQINTLSSLLRLLCPVAPIVMLPCPVQCM